MVTPLYEIKGLKHFYDQRCVLWIEELSIPEGGVTVLLGANGAGKSTFLRLLGFLETPTEGKILFRGKPLKTFAAETRKIVLLPQEPYLLKRSVFENIAYGLKIRGLKRNLTPLVYEALSLVGLKGEEFAQRPWYALSGGEAQRVALASRLVLKAEVLLLDEPTASVDAQSARIIKEAIIQAQNRWGTNLIIATHDWHWVSEIADRWLYFFNQRVWEEEMPIFIPGPWRKEKNYWIKIFSDGTSLIFEAPADPSLTVAVIGRKEVDFSPKKKKTSVNLLDFQITQVSFKQKTGHLLVSLNREELSFTLEIKPQDFPFLPGEKLWLSLPQKVKKWL